MRTSIVLHRFAVFAACACLAAGCRRGGGADAAGPAKIDTANTAWEDGMSAEQVQEEAKAMSPEQAAQAGLSVDTSIHLEELGARDSFPGRATPTPPPPATGAADTVPRAAAPVAGQPAPAPRP